MQLLSGADKFLATQYESDCRIRIVLTYCDWEWNHKEDICVCDNKICNIACYFAFVAIW